MDDKLDFLDGPTPEPTAAPEPQAETPAAEAPAPVSDGPARGPDGKFAPKAPADAAPAADATPQAPASPPEAVPAEAAKAPDGYVPIGALQAIRDELNALKRQPQQPAQPAPDPYEDFEAYQAYQQDQMTQERANWSRQLAEAKHGAETVAATQQWAAERFAADPIFAQRALSSPDPYGFAIAEYEQHQALQMLTDPKLRDQFKAFVSGQAPALAAAPPVAAPTQPPTPPRSLAAVPNAGGAKPGAQPVGPNVAFDTVFRE